MPREKFTNPHVLLTVIHARTTEQVDKNIATAVAARADGIVLVDHLKGADDLTACFRKARKDHPSLWMMPSFFDFDASSAITLTEVLDEADGVWLDDIGLTDASDGMASYLRSLRKSFYSNPLIFGGVAFDKQTEVKDHARTARVAASCVDVITTSGGSIGVPPDIGMVSTIKAEIGDKPLAIVSGITAANVGDYMPYAKYFLVGTGVSDPSDDDLPGNLNPKLLHELVTKLHRGADLLFPS